METLEKENNMNSAISLYRNKNSVVTDAFDRTIVNICQQKEKYGHKIFLLCGCEPRVGTTTVSVELAISLAIAGWKVLLLDGDLRKEKEYKRLNDGSLVGMADCINGAANREDIIRKTNWFNLDYMPSGNVDNYSPINILYANRMVGIIDEVKNDYDFILIDAPALSAAVDASIFAMKADATILIAAMDGRKRKWLDQTYDLLMSSDVNVIGVIENRVDMKEYKSYINNFNYFKNKQYIKKARRKK
ncbi:MAG: CpsD/CapB family tyrosine-protein kinase [Lachnospiraceae bacterium]|nr:CpsD/CapB family tyrosine-protein kinase [Lachnospiraceae bacterium]